MNYRSFAWFTLAAAPFALLAPKTAFAQDDGSTTNLNHFRLSARVGFNITGRFKNLGSLTLTPSGRTTPNGDPYNYDNGYVLTDVSGSAGGQTWYWGYDGPGQISGNTILMTRSTPSGNTEAPGGIGSGDPDPGFEFVYDRELGSHGKLHYGVEAAINYTRVSFNDHSAFAGNVTHRTDAYPFTPGTTPPATPPPYQGTYDGPGFLLGATPISSSTVTTGGAIITGQREFDSDIIGFRLGPYVEYPLTQKLDLSVSAGLAVGFLMNSASWNEVITIGGNQAATSSGSGNNTAFVLGGYISADLSYQFSKRWSAEGGVQFQDLGTYQQNVGTRAIELDLSKSLFVTLSVGYHF
ncbi:MAG TPA: hypothetical protein VG754_02670 [Verrucomicrobiae bacterium]|nr:hypothetical protein [Verrucomicrobiae bacterium]